MGIEEIIIEMAKQEGKMEGKMEGETKKSEFFVKNLLQSTDFSIEKIASLAGVSQEFVKEIKAKFSL